MGILRLLEFFQEPNGGLSSTRLVLISWAVAILGIWSYNSVISKTLQPIPESVIVMFGVVTSSKVIQRYGEKETDKASETK